MVDTQIVLKHKVEWNYEYSWDHSSDTAWVGFIALNFENGDNYVPNQFRNQQRGNLRIISQNFNKRFEGIQQHYYYNEMRLDTSTIYLLEGTIGFRDWMRPDSIKLKDTIFINQSNNVTYWSQTFQFNLKRIFIQ